MRQRNHAVDVVVTLQAAAAVEMIGNRMGYGGGTVHRRDDADIVAGADLAIWPQISFESASLCVRHKIDHRNVRREMVRDVAVLHGDVLQMDVVTRRNIAAGDADRLAVFRRRLALGNSTDRDLVTPRDDRRCNDSADT
ncbi:hypothetical protein D3C71_1605870 [compost metagenome]